MVGGGDPSTWSFGLNWPRFSENGDFQPIFAHSASAVTHSEKSSININRKFTTRFQVSLRWKSYVAPKPPKGGSKTPNSHFPCKIALRLKKVCYIVSFCENCQRQSCKSLYIFGQNNWRGMSPSTWKFGGNWSIPLQNADFQSIFRS